MEELSRGQFASHLPPRLMQALPPLGSLPLAPGHVRAVHATYPEHAGSIREHGLLLSRSKADLTGDPRVVWATPVTADDIHEKTKGYQTVVEVQVPEHEAKSDPITLERDIEPKDVLAVHEPWEMALHAAERDPGDETHIGAGGFIDYVGDNPTNSDGTPNAYWNEHLARAAAYRKVASPGALGIE